MIPVQYMRISPHLIGNKTGAAKTETKFGAICSRGVWFMEHGASKSDMSFGNTRVCSQNVEIYKYYRCVVLGPQIPSFAQYAVGYFIRRGAITGVPLLSLQIVEARTSMRLQTSKKGQCSCTTMTAKAQASELLPRQQAVPPF